MKESIMQRSLPKCAKIAAVLLLLAGYASCDKAKPQQTTCHNSRDFSEPYEVGVFEDELCVRYQPIWKELFLEETGFTEDYFSMNVFLCFMGRATIIEPGSPNRHVFEIRYEVRVGWAMISHTDSFVIQHGDGPYLMEEDIKRERIPFKYHKELSNHDILKFSSLKSAMSFLKKQVQVDHLCTSFIHYNANGDFILAAHASYVDDPRRHIFAYLNLITGEASHNEIWSSSF